MVWVNLIRYYRQPQLTLSYDIEDSRWRRREEKTETCSHPRTHCCESETSWKTLRVLYDQWYKSIDGASVSPLIVFTQQAKAEQNSTGIVALINPRRGTKRGHSIYKINNWNAIEIQQKEQTAKKNESHGGSEESFIDLMSILLRKQYIIISSKLSHNRLVLFHFYELKSLELHHLICLVAVSVLPPLMPSVSVRNYLWAIRKIVKSIHENAMP